MTPTLLPVRPGLHLTECWTSLSVSLSLSLSRKDTDTDRMDRVSVNSSLLTKAISRDAKVSLRSIQSSSLQMSTLENSFENAQLIVWYRLSFQNELVVVRFRWRLGRLSTDWSMDKAFSLSFLMIRITSNHFHRDHWMGFSRKIWTSVRECFFYNDVLRNFHHIEKCQRYLMRSAWETLLPTI